MAPTASAGWPLDRLVSALARAGWAELDKRRAGGYRAVLRALTDLLPHGSATGMVTANQLADAAGMSERWTRDRLGWLEHAGIITWTRGGIRDGRPTPSLITVSKRALADLVNRARGQISERLAARAAETSKRIRETIRLATLLHASKPKPNPSTAKPRPARRPIAAAHAELSASPLPYRGGNGAPPAPAEPPRTKHHKPIVVNGSRRQALRARLEVHRA